MIPAGYAAMTPLAHRPATMAKTPEPRAETTARLPKGRPNCITDKKVVQTFECSAFLRSAEMQETVLSQEIDKGTQSQDFEPAQ